MALLLIPGWGIQQMQATASYENLARKATLTASYTADFSNLSAVNDGKTKRPARATHEDYYCNWHGELYYGEMNYLQYDFPFKAQIASNMVYWYNNADSISLPSVAYIEYWNLDSSKWVRSNNVDTLAAKFNNDNSFSFVTTKVRLYMQGAKATGVIEWQVYGYQICDTAIHITPYVRENEGAYQATYYINASKGSTITLFPDATIVKDEEQSWTWSGPNGFTATGQTLSLTNVTSAASGTYKVTYTNVCEDVFTQNFIVNVGSLDKGSLYDWPKYTPALNYDFRSEYPTLQPPTKVLQDDSHAVGTITKGWWCFRWGKNRRSVVTDAAIDKLLDRMNTDFAYFRDKMGWPPDDRAKNGYYCTVYLYGSGLNDGADSTALGGWQSANSYNGKSWPMVLLSYYPVASFDPKNTYSDRISQQGACVHEGIHAVLAGLPGCKNSAWFQEGGNTWLQQQYAATTSNDFSEVGWLNGGPFIAPFMPIECYSGWLQDYSFGGPSAEGVNMYNSSGSQVCTWMKYLGGVQYANSFPCCIGEILGEKSIPWIWRYCGGRVLEGMSDSIGDTQMRRLIMEYRARQATFDLGRWSSAFRKVTSNNFGGTIGPEWSPYWINCPTWKSTPYAITTKDSEGWLTPEYRTTPGWSGANQIPLNVTGDTCSVIFEPLGANMSCQLVYRSTTGYAYYSEPVMCGECVLSMPEKPSNGVVIAVICNTDYIYKGEATRKAHFNYRLKMGKNVTGTAATTTAWFNKWTLKSDKNPYVGVKSIELPANGGLNFKVAKSVLSPGDKVYVDYNTELQGGIEASLYTAAGKLCGRYSLPERGEIALPATLSKGIYMLQLAADGKKQSLKLVIK